MPLGDTEDVQRTVGGDRFEVIRRLGAGGMGVVFEAFDRKRGGRVALKTLREVDPVSIFRFKNEFRALADLVHPNLVTLYELLSLDGEWVLSMELINGVNFLEHVRPRLVDTSPRSEREAVTRDALVSVADQAAHRHRGPLAEDRLRPALVQLAQGVAAVHQAGKLHRDIKPSNVLVETTGRVALCDFGLIMGTGEGAGSGKHRTDRSGTPLYMSPEQAEGKALGPSSDWYSVGVMLYEVLAGRMPFRGEIAEVVQRKRAQVPVRPSELEVGIPTDLEDLCMGLLHPEPTERLSGAEVLLRLTRNAGPITVEGAAHEGLFLGREQELTVLRTALAASRNATGVTLIHAPSGFGKTALLQRFLDEARDGGALVLASRCYERETVPYKAVDGLIDALTSHLLQCSPTDLSAVLPKEMFSLARLFPVLRRLPSLAAGEAPEREIPEPHVLRRRAFQALGELLAALSRERALVLAVDDLQWGDSDSAALLAELLRNPPVPGWLMACTYRTEEGPTSGAVTALQEWGAPAGPKTRDLQLGGLTPEEGKRLARELLVGSELDPEQIAQEAAGHPFLLQELVRHRPTGGTREGKVTLEEVLGARVRALPDMARSLLEVIAVAGAPIERQVARHAASLGAAENSALAALRSQRLVRVRSAGEEEWLESYHDRVRETVRDGLVPEQRVGLHRRLALAFESIGTSDQEALAEHWLGAGERARAQACALRGADAASQALAFDRAARGYRQALELGGAIAAQADVWKRLAESLSNAGRGAGSADAYLEAAQVAPPVDRPELKRLALSQLMRSGRMDIGVKLLRDLLAGEGILFPESHGAALRTLIALRIRLAFQSLHLPARARRTADPRTLFKVDLCDSAAQGLAFVDAVRAAGFQARQRILAHAAGEPQRFARAVMAEVVGASLPGERTLQKTERLFGVAKKAADEVVGSPFTQGVMLGSRGIARYLQGRWVEGTELCESATKILRDQCTGADWELASSNLFLFRTLLMRGEVRELARRVPLALSEAVERGNFFAETNFRAHMGYFLGLVAGDVEAARAEARQSLYRWTQQDFHLQHYFQRVGENQVDLYEGRGASAHRRFREVWGPLTRAHVLRSQTIRIMVHYFLASAALLEWSHGGSEARMWEGEAKHCTHTLERERTRWGRGLGLLLRAGLAHGQGDDAAAASLLAQADQALITSDMHLYATAARWRRGQLVGGEAGRTDSDAARSWMVEQGIRDPERFLAMLTPGY